VSGRPQGISYVDGPGQRIAMAMVFGRDGRDQERMVEAGIAIRGKGWREGQLVVARRRRALEASKS